jgi:hypothetical protein
MNGSVLPARNVVGPMKQMLTDIARQSKVGTFCDPKFMPGKVAANRPSVKVLSPIYFAFILLLHSECNV